MYFTFLLLHCCTVHFYYTCSNFMNVALCWPLRAKSLFSYCCHPYQVGNKKFYWIHFVLVFLLHKGRQQLDKAMMAMILHPSSMQLFIYTHTHINFKQSGIGMVSVSADTAQPGIGIDIGAKKWHRCNTSVYMQTRVCLSTNRVHL